MTPRHIRPAAGTCPLSHVYAKLSVANRIELAAPQEAAERP
jgi:hypothetical protein